MKRFESLIYVLVLLGFVARYALETDEPPTEPTLPDGKTGTPAFVTPVPKQQLDYPDPFDVTVEIEPRRSHGSGTAFLVSDTGRWITARHVVQGCEELYLEVAPGRALRVDDVVENRRADMAVLTTRALRIAPVKYASSMPERGDAGYMPGYPQGRAGDIYAQMIGNKRMRTAGQYDVRERVLAWTERQRRPSISGSLGGLSGGPVFNSQGEVVGIAVAESRRRGRIYSAHPAVFRNGGLVQAGDGTGNAAAQYPLDPENFDQVGKNLRRKLTVAKAVCINR